MKFAILILGILAVAAVAYAAPEESEDVELMSRLIQLQQELETGLQTMADVDENELENEVLVQNGDIAKIQGWRFSLDIGWD